MTLENIYYIGQTIAVIAIIGSLLAVMIQMRQTNRLLRNQATRDQIDNIKSPSEWMLRIPGLADISVRANTSGIETLTEAERIQFFSYLTIAERSWESAYVQFKDGLITKELWQSHLEQARTVWNTIPAVREHWAVRRGFFTAEYQAFHDAEIARDSGATLYGHRPAGPSSEPAEQAP